MSHANTSHAEDAPCCSVIVPVYNGEGTILHCLDALARQNVGLDRYEVIVVDDGSQDGTAEAVRGWLQGHIGLNLRLLQQANAGPAAARNNGAGAAVAPLLLFTDADCEPARHWISSLTLPFEDEHVFGAKGTYLSDQQGLMPRFVQAEYEDRYDRMAGLEKIDFIDTYSAAYRRDVFCENGGFNPIFTTASVEDQELSFRLASKGYRLVFAPDAQVRHTHDVDLGEYMRRKYYIGYWKALLTRLHPERMVKDSHTPQVLKVQILLLATTAATALLAVLGLFWPPLLWFWALTALLVVAFLAVSLPFLIKLAGTSWQLALVGPIMLAVRAGALGAGFLVGTIHFAGTLPARPLD